MIVSEEWKTFQPYDATLAIILLPEEVFPYLKEVWTELGNLHVGTVWNSICTYFE
jgi:hypothetical protein